MSVAIQPLSQANRLPPAMPNDLVFRLTVDDYHEMLKHGILGEDDAVELLEGWLIVKMTKHPRHSLSTQITREALRCLLLVDWFVNTHEPITTVDSEPEPDVSVIRGNCRDYSKNHPAPKDVGLVVEIADISLERDRGIKKRLYARAQIPCYWIVNLMDRQVEVFTDPTGPADEPDFRHCRIFAELEEVPVMLDGVEVGKIAVSELLP